MSHTYTYVTLDVPPADYDYVRYRLEKSGYGHQIDGSGTIDMHGLALVRGADDLDPRVVVSTGTDTTDCRTDSGITVGLIDALISIARVLAQRDLLATGVQEALTDLRSDKDFMKLIPPTEW